MVASGRQPAAPAGGGTGAAVPAEVASWAKSTAQGGSGAGGEPEGSRRGGRKKEPERPERSRRGRRGAGGEPGRTEIRHGGLSETELSFWDWGRGWGRVARCDRYTIISADTHAGGSHAQYREFLDPKFLDDFDAWRGKYRNPFNDLGDRRASATGTTRCATPSRTPTASSAR